MRVFVPITVLGLLLFASCSKSFDKYMPEPEPEVPTSTNDQIQENVQNVFGVKFDENHDWTTTYSDEVTITANSSVKKVQVMSLTSEPGGDDVAEGETVTSMRVMNEAELDGETTIKLYYDAPKDNLGIYVAFIGDNLYTVKKVTGTTVSIEEAVAKTRALPEGFTLPTGEFAIGKTVESWASQRGWLPGEVLYELSDYSTQKMSAPEYSDEYKGLFRSMIFSYFKNGRDYKNLSLVTGSGIYNESAYPVTTGNDPIIISPIYKRDQAKKWGNEVWNSDLYYYYFKEENLGNDPVAYLQSLPKYKAIPFNECFGETEDDLISKRCAYALLYYGDGTPEIGTKGTYTFPEGYKIGFMVRAKTTSEAPKKQGELYGDGRLNNKINAWPNFKSSNLGNNGPRVAWLSLNGRLLMCWESGTDSDFNDIILEVEGGIEEIPALPMEVEYTYYTYCFEDTEFGDYDLNDVVVKAVRKDETTVEYSVVACGAYHELTVMNINCGAINDNAEIHGLFGKGPNQFINTEKNATHITPLKVTKKVDKWFSFLNPDTYPYIHDLTTDKYVYLSKKGEDPHGIMIPKDFKYPYEKVCIKDAYKSFNDWGEYFDTSTDWYTKPELDKVYAK